MAEAPPRGRRFRDRSDRPRHQHRGTFGGHFLAADFGLWWRRPRHLRWRRCRPGRRWRRRRPPSGGRRWRCSNARRWRWRRHLRRRWRRCRDSRGRRWRCRYPRRWRRRGFCHLRSGRRRRPAHVRRHLRFRCSRRRRWRRRWLCHLRSGRRRWVPALFRRHLRFRYGRRRRWRQRGCGLWLGCGSNRRRLRGRVRHNRRAWRWPPGPEPGHPVSAGRVPARLPRPAVSERQRFPGALGASTLPEAPFHAEALVWVGAAQASHSDWPRSADFPLRSAVRAAPLAPDTGLT